MSEKVITITPSEAESLAEFIEFNVFDAIRNDTEIDSMVWLCNICEIYKKAKWGADNDNI